MNKNFKFITGVLSFVLCFAAFAFGQRTSGNIEGTITDPAGAVVAGASVTLKNAGTTTGLTATTTSNGEGYFRFSNIPSGFYTVTATGANFKTSKRDVEVVTDTTTSADIKLEIGVSSVVVDVTTDSAVTIDQSSTKIDTTITKKIIEDLPAGTTFGSLLKIAPNVRPEAGGFQIDGASGSENVFIIDGQEVTNFRTGSLNGNFNLPFELVQEVQIKSTGFEAEFGGAMGGVINVVTGGGNNEWHGNFGASFRPAKLAGDPRVVLNRFGSTAGSFEYFQPPKDGGVAFFPVANFSGPIVKEKLWFSAAYAPQIFETDRKIAYFSTGSNPTGRTVSQVVGYNQNFRQEEAFFRLDAQPHSKLRVFGTFLWNPIVQDGVLPASTEGLSGAPQSVNFGGSIGTLSGADLLARQGGRQNANAFNTQATWIPTSNLTVNFRYGRSFLNEKLNSYFLPQATRYICSTSNAGIPAGAGCTSGFQNIGNNFQIAYDVSTRNTFDADAGVGVNLGGRHNFKFGYQNNKLFNTVDQGYKGLGIITLFYGIPISAQGVPNTPTAGNLGSGRLQRFGTVGEASSKSQSLYGQDSWQIASRLTVNLGLRIEKEEVPNFGSTGSQAIQFGWGDKISPRFGFAFDLTGDNKTKVFANYGWFYDRFKYELPRGSFGGDFFRRDFFEILPARGVAFNGYTLANILGSNPDPIGGTCPIVGGTGYSVCQFDFRVATNLIGADIFETGAVDPNLKAARQSEYTFGVERLLGRDFVLAGRYTHKQVDRAIEDVGVFNAQGSEAYIIGNPGFGLVCTVASTANLPCPKAERKYDAVEVRLDKRSTNYFFNGSYTWSRLFGNYSGLASTDEAGRNSPNVNRFFDLPPLGFNANGDPDNGRLATDRPHVFKAYGGYSFDWKGNNIHRTGVTAFTTIQSGTPNTTIYNLYSLGTTILNNRGDLGRTEMFTETDFSVSHRYKFGADARFTLEGFVDILNLFNESNVLTVQNNISDQNFVASTLTTGGCTTCGSEAAVFQTIFNGPGIQAFVNNVLTSRGVSATGIRNDYKLANGFQGPRTVRFGFRLFF